MTFGHSGWALPLLLLALSLATASRGGESAEKTELGIQGTRFTLNGRPTFLLGISYYGALGASRDFIRRDLDDMQHHGFNWIRVWATWAAFGNNVAAFDAEGKARGPFMGRLRWLVAECDRRGVVVDVTLSRGNGVVGAPRLQKLDVHRRAVETVISALQAHRNWYLDLGNERNIRDRRHVPFDELAKLRAAAKRLDPKRLVTASHAGDIAARDLRLYLEAVGVDFISPHRPRHPRSPGQTKRKSSEYLAAMKDLGRVVPLHYQEPFRRGFTRGWEPKGEDYVADLRGAIQGGAAGWCLHNGSERHGRGPRRSFDLRERRLFDQLDAVEHQAIEALGRLIAGEKDR